MKDASLLFIYLEPHDCLIMKHEAKHHVNIMFTFSLKWCYKAIVDLAVEKNLSFLLFSTLSSLYAVSNTAVSSLPAGLVRSSIPLLLEQTLFQCSSSPTQHNPLPRPTAELFQYFLTPLLSQSVLIHFLLFSLSTFFSCLLRCLPFVFFRLLLHHSPTSKSTSQTTQRKICLTILSTLRNSTWFPIYWHIHFSTPTCILTAVVCVLANYSHHHFDIYQRS